MSPNTNARSNGVFPASRETQQTRVLEQLLARIARDIPELTRLLDESALDSTIRSTLDEPIMETLARIDEAEGVAADLQAVPGVSQLIKRTASSAQGSLELARMVLAMAAARSDISSAD